MVQNVKLLFKPQMLLSAREIDDSFDYVVFKTISRFVPLMAQSRSFPAIKKNDFETNQKDEFLIVDFI